MWGAITLGGLIPNFLVVYVPELITRFKFGDDRFRGLASAEGQILPFPIDFDGRPYNTLTLPCERVIMLNQRTYIYNIFLGNPRWGCAWGVHKLPRA